MRLVGILKPKISVIENVPGMLNMKILRRDNNEEIKQLCNELNDICEKQKKVRGRLIAETKKETDETTITSFLVISDVVAESLNLSISSLI